MKVFLLDSIVLSSKLIFSSCYLDRIEGDAENDDMEPMNSDDQFQILASLWDDKCRYFTSLSSEDFIFYMNQIGWPQGGVFSTLLSTVGYGFREENGLMVSQAKANKVEDALTLLIFELYVPSTIAIISSESASKNIDCPSIFWRDQTFNFR